MNEETFAPSFELDDDDNEGSTNTTTIQVDTSQDAPTFELDDDDTFADEAAVYVGPEIDVSEQDIETQTAEVLGYVPVTPEGTPEDVDTRIEAKFQLYKQYLAKQFNADYVQSAEDAQAEDVKWRMEELDRRNLTIEQAREIAASKGDDVLKTFESNFSNPEIVGAEAYKDAMALGEEAKGKLLARLKSKNFVTSGITEQLLDSPLSLPEINYLVSGDEIINPVTAVVQAPIHYANIQENFKKGEYWKASGNIALMLLDLTAADVVARPAVKMLNKAWSTAGKGTGRGYLLTQEAMTNETAVANTINTANKAAADAAAEMRSDYILDFEDRINSIRRDSGQEPISISKLNEKTGFYEIDPTKTREHGAFLVEEAYRKNDMGIDNIDIDQQYLDELSVGQDNIAIPILKPEKLDALIAMASGFKNTHPQYFKKGEKTIDSLFRLTVDKELMASEELMEMLTKHGMSYEEYILGVVGSGSQAGRLLAKISHIKRSRPQSLTDQRKAQAEAMENSVRNWYNNTVVRAEGIRRGILVSSWATTARNIGSAGIVQPLASIANLADAAMVAGSGKRNLASGVASGIAALGKGSTWKGSFNNLNYIFRDQEFASEMTDYLLKYPELSGQYEKMFNGIGEIQKTLGRGQANTKLGTGYDATMSKIEDGVQFLNTPNRWQDHVMRRGTFVAELERRVKLEYDLDLQEVIREGRIQELLNDASSVRPEGKPSFLTLVEDSSKRAMDLTFSGTPNNKLLANISNTIVKSGIGTVVIPFPRFMMTSLEWMGDHTTGALQVPLRKMLLKTDGVDAPITQRDREQISRNLVGWASISAMYMARTSEDMPSDYKRITSGDKDLDVTAQYPLRQISWIAEYMRRNQFTGDDTLASWNGWNFTDVTETFLGMQARTGTSNIFVEEIGNFIAGGDDMKSQANFDRVFGRFMGQFAGSYFVPFVQITTAQTALGIRDNEMKDHSSLYKPGLENQMGQNFSRSFNQSQLFMAPSTTNALPERETLQEQNPKRVNQGLKLFFGLNYYEKDSDDIDFLKDIGWSDPTYSLGSRKREKPAKTAINKELSKILPEIVATAKVYAEDASKAWEKDPYLKSQYGSAKTAYNTEARRYVVDMFKNSKANLSQYGDDQLSELSMAIRAYKRLTKINAAAALLEFIKRRKNKPINKKRPDWSNPDDLYELIELGKNIEK